MFNIFNRVTCTPLACGLDPYREPAMHMSDVILDCAQQCARLSRECGDRETGIALYKISVRLMSVLEKDAELQWSEAQEASQPANQAEPCASNIHRPGIVPRKAQR
jgi:hypothetical protein